MTPWRLLNGSDGPGNRDESLLTPGSSRNRFHTLLHATFYFLTGNGRLKLLSMV